jgi:hypothetical protein
VEIEGQYIFAIELLILTFKMEVKGISKFARSHERQRAQAPVT